MVTTPSGAPIMEISQAVTGESGEKRLCGEQAKDHLPKKAYHSLKERILHQVDNIKYILYFEEPDISARKNNRPTQSTARVLAPSARVLALCGYYT